MFPDSQLCWKNFFPQSFAECTRQWNSRSSDWDQGSLKALCLRNFVNDPSERQQSVGLVSLWPQLRDTRGQSQVVSRTQKGRAVHERHQSFQQKPQSQCFPRKDTHSTDHKDRWFPNCVEITIRNRVIFWSVEEALDLTFMVGKVFSSQSSFLHVTSIQTEDGRARRDSRSLWLRALQPEAPLSIINRRCGSQIRTEQFDAHSTLALQHYDAHYQQLGKTMQQFHEADVRMFAPRVWDVLTGQVSLIQYWWQQKVPNFMGQSSVDFLSWWKSYRNLLGWQKDIRALECQHHTSDGVSATITWAHSKHQRSVPSGRYVRSFVNPQEINTCLRKVADM